MRICNHCKYPIDVEPPKGVGCRHLYYPEHCKLCADKARMIVTVVQWDLERITTEVPDATQT